MVPLLHKTLKNLYNRRFEHFMYTCICHLLDLSASHFSFLSVGFFYFVHMYIGFPYRLLLPFLVLLFDVFLRGQPHVSQCCYSSSNFLCGCFIVLGPLLLLYQLYLHVSPLFCLMAAIPANHFQFLPPVFTGILYLPVFEWWYFLAQRDIHFLLCIFKLTMGRLNFILF